MTNPQPNRKIPCEIYSRIVGYLRPVSAWNVAKKQEFIDRVIYNVGTVSGQELELENNEA